jgi:tetratricopeptide (TPR) repeat protein
MTAYKKAQQLAPKDPAAQLGLGMVALQNQRYDEALKYFSDASALNPSDGVAYLMAGRALIAKGDLPKAIETLGEAQTRMPNDPDVAVAIGAALEQEGRPADALDKYSESVRLAPHEPKNQLLVAHLAEKLGAFDRARDAYAGAITEGGGDVATRRQLADLFERTGHLDDAAVTLTDASRAFPQEPDLWVHLAEVQYRLKQFDPAIASLKPALSLPGAHLPRAHELMALLLYHQGNAPGAIGELDEALKISPDMAEAHYQKGQILEGTGQLDKAKSAYEKALQLKPMYTDAIFALRRLEGRGK